MFLPENIDLAHSEKYNLSIRLTPNGFSFCIFSPTDPSIFNFQETSLSSSLSNIENIKKLIFDFGFFSQTYNETTVTIVSPNYTLVPEQFYDKKKAREIFSYNFHEPEGVVLSESIPACSSYLLFNIDDEIHSFLTRHLSVPIFKHYIYLLINLFKAYNVNGYKKRCFVDFSDDSVSVICFDGEKLLSANTFEATNSSDTSYYIFNVWEKLKLDQNNDFLYVSGDLEKNGTVIKNLEKLIKNVKPVTLNSKIDLKEHAKDIPTDLMAKLCE